MLNNSYSVVLTTYVIKPHHAPLCRLMPRFSVIFIYANVAINHTLLNTRFFAYTFFIADSMAVS